MINLMAFFSLQHVFPVNGETILNVFNLLELFCVMETKLCIFV